MIELSLSKLNILASLAIFLMASSTLLKNKSDTIRVLYTVNLFLLGFGYYFRNFSMRDLDSTALNMEHFIFSIVPFTVTLFLQTLGKLELDIKFKLLVSISCLFFAITAFTPWHIHPYWLAGYFIYQIINPLYILKVSITKYRSSPSPLQKKLVSTIIIIVFSVMFITFIDWFFSRHIFARRPSALIIFPLLYLTTIIVNNPVHQSLFNELRSTALQIAKALLVAFIFNYYWKFQSKYSIYIYFFTFLIIDLSLRSVTFNMRKLFAVDLSTILKELILYKRSDRNTSINGIEAINVIDKNVFAENSMLDIYESLLKTNGPISTFEVSSSLLFDSNLKNAEELERIQHFFQFFDCHIFNAQDSGSLVTIKLSNPENFESNNVSVGKIASLIVGSK